MKRPIAFVVLVSLVAGCSGSLATTAPTSQVLIVTAPPAASAAGTLAPTAEPTQPPVTQPPVTEPPLTQPPTEPP